MHETTAIYSLLAVVAAIGCSDAPYDPPAFDPHAPRVDITSPERGTIAGDVELVVVTGTASDDSGAVASVLVNDLPATLAADGTWVAEVAVTPGTNLLQAVAFDAQGNHAIATRAVVAGPMVTLARPVPHGITATLSPQTIQTLGHGAATFIEGDDLMTAVQGMNPVIDSGDGPDCLYVQASITSLSIGDADVQLTPQDGGIAMSTALRDVRVGMHLQWAVACLNGSRDVVITASRVTVQGVLEVGVVDRAFDIHLANQHATVTGLNVQLAGVPDAIIDMLALETALGPILGWATERFVGPLLDTSLAPLTKRRTIAAFGTEVDIELMPSLIDFTPAGGTVLLHTSLRAKGDSGSFVYVPNLLPSLDMSRGFQLAVADDATNQLLASTWSTKAMNERIELAAASHGNIGRFYEAAQLEVMVPPYVEARDGRLVLTLGDMLATFELGGEVAAQVAINAHEQLQVVQDDTGALRIEVYAPTVFVDAIGEGLAPLSNAQLAAIESFAEARIETVGSTLLGAIPLPAIGDVMPTNLSIDQQHGYLIVSGEVQ